MHPRTFTFRRAQAGDYPDMLALQAENFIGNLAPGQTRDGFLSIEYTTAQFDEINQNLGISVAVRNGRVVGYLCACTFSYGSRFPILAELIRNLQGRLMDAALVICACRLCRKGGSEMQVPGEGTADFPIMFVGEAPGKEEAKIGRPFVGRSGAFLRRMIREAGMEEGQVFITSPVHYLPDSGKPSPGMIEHGATHLRKQVEAIKPRLVVLLGKSACRALLGRSIEIAKQHGTVIEQDGISFLISFHPAYAMLYHRHSFFLENDT
jgi:uracil-DNA glycosylase family 4